MTAAENRGFDPNALRAKYDAERDKRLRSDANEQYRELKGGLAHYMEDTYSESQRIGNSKALYGSDKQHYVK